jgi:hypothetical protein
MTIRQPEDINFEDRGKRIRIARFIPNERRDAKWVVFNEGGVSFTNAHNAEHKTVMSPVGAALRTEFPDATREGGENVTVGVQKVDNMGSDYMTEGRTVHVVKSPGYYAKDETGDYGIGGSMTEAVYNTSEVIDLMEKF